MFRIRKANFIMVAALASLISAGAAQAVTVPFTEDFSADSANWKFDAAGATPAGWSATGGPDGGSYATSLFNFSASGPGSTPLFFRAQEEFNSSGNAFVGNWITAGVTEIGMWVRHDAGIPLDFFTRITGPGNFPGVAGLYTTSVQSGVWTQLALDIVPGNPLFVFEGGPSNFGSVFGNVGHVQVGVLTPAALVNTDQSVRFDLDKIGIVPEPASLMLMALGGAAAMFRRRTR